MTIVPYSFIRAPMTVLQVQLVPVVEVNPSFRTTMSPHLDPVISLHGGFAPFTTAFRAISGGKTLKPPPP